MVGTRKAKEEDSNIWFSTDKKSGILVQPKLRKLIYFVNGEKVDTIFYETETKASELETWIQAKRKHYLNFINTKNPTANEQHEQSTGALAR